MECWILDPEWSMLVAGKGKELEAPSEPWADD